MGLSRAVLWLAQEQPLLMRGVLRLWLKAHVLGSRGRPRDAHWLMLEMANRLHYRLPVKARLGNGTPMWVPLNDQIGDTIYSSGYYEPDLVAVLQRLLEPGMIFFDVGAHIGQYSLVGSEAVGSQGQVHSFEPDPETYWFLDASIRLNRLRNVKSHCVALSSEPGTKSLYLAPVSRLGDSSLAPPKNYSGVARSVTCTTLDAYMATNRVPRIDFMKVDIEGAELDLLRGGSKLFGGPDRPIIVMEFEEARQQAFGTSCVMLADALRSHGYELLTGAGARWQSYTPSAADPVSLNVLAVPEHRRDAILGALKGLIGSSSHAG